MPWHSWQETFYSVKFHLDLVDKDSILCDVMLILGLTNTCQHHALLINMLLSTAQKKKRRMHVSPVLASRGTAKSLKESLIATLDQTPSTLLQHVAMCA